jgi:hypothetical protein
MRTRFIFGLIAVLLGTGLVRAQVPIDSVRRPARQPDAARWQSLRTDRDFQYGTETAPTVSLWDQLVAQFWDWLRHWLLGPENATTREWLTGVVVVAILAFAAYKIWQMDRLNPFIRPQPTAPLDYDVTTEDIHAISFEEELTRALDNQNYRLAVRLLYLQTLKRLADRTLIRWQVDKTNRAYVQELDGGLAGPFERLTARFEYVWYGHFAPDEPQFQALRAEFTAFAQLLSTP